MNKTVTINISGIIFHIEEDAFQKLSNYLSSIKSYFGQTEGGSEILSDIEARIAEMLQSKISPVKQVVLMPDVDSVIEIMGKPEQFADESAGTEQPYSQTKNQSAEDPNIKRRLFRDPDHKAIGGVCSGIAAYFDIDIIWIRLAMFLLIFFGGISIWVYIVLWIVIPQAKTTADKLAMRGERIDINNISKSVKEEAEQFKKRAQKYGDDIRKSNQPRNFFEKLGDFLKEFIIMFTRFFVKVVGLVLLIFGVLFMLGLASSIFGFSIAGRSGEFNDWINLFFLERSHYSLGMLGLILFFGVPTLMMIYGGVKLLFGIRYSNKWLNIGAGLVWFAGFLLALFVGITTGKDFSESGKVKDQIQLHTKSDTLYLSLNKNKEIYSQLNLNDEEDEDEDSHNKKHFFKKGSHKSDYIIGKNNDTKFIVGYATMDIVQSSSDNFELYVVKTARGEDKRSAVDRSKTIKYNITQNDSMITFDEWFTLEPLEKFRVQSVRVVLKVPRNKVVYLDKSLEHFIYDVENVTNTFDGDMVGHRWIMTKDGLNCMDCEGIIASSDASKSKHDSGAIKIEPKDANVKIGKDGINIKSSDGDVKINKDGISIDTKEKK